MRQNAHVHLNTGDLWSRKFVAKFMCFNKRKKQNKCGYQSTHQRELVIQHQNHNFLYKLSDVKVGKDCRLAANTHQKGFIYE